MGIGKIVFSEAESIANKVRQHIAPVMDRVEVAGSIRRQKEVVGDIEICGVPADRARLIALRGALSVGLTSTSWRTGRATKIW